MPSQVYLGSPRRARLEANEALPAKLDLIFVRPEVTYVLRREDEFAGML